MKENFDSSANFPIFPHTHGVYYTRTKSSVRKLRFFLLTLLIIRGLQVFQRNDKTDKNETKKINKGKKKFTGK